MPTRRDLILVTAGLGLDGGGRAVVGRLLAQAGAEWAADAGVGFRVLDLGDGAPEPLASELRGLGAEVVTAGGSRARLARAVWRAQLTARPSRRPALLFDLLGIARLEAPLPPALRSPYLVTLYGVEIWRPIDPCRERALRQASVRCGISEAALARAEPFLPIPRRELSLLPLALEDRPPTGAIDPATVGRAGSGFVLIVGRMGATERYKGHDELLEAWPEVARAAPDARLVVAGGGDDLRRLEAKAEALGVADRTVFTGFVGEATLAELYRHAAVFAMPSRGEGFGLVYLEAMREGLPVVALDGTAAAEIVVPGETGLLVPAEPPDRLVSDLARSLGDLLSDPERARTLGAAGRERWLQRYTSERFRATLSTHCDMLTDRTATP